MALNVTEKIVFGFVMLLIAIVLIGVVADNVLATTSKTTKTETIDLSSSRVGGGSLSNSTFNLSTGVSNWRNDFPDCIPTTVVYKNQTGGVMDDPTNYVYIYNLGTLQIKNTSVLYTAASNTTTVSYAYCPDGYVTSDFGRTSTNLIPGFFALAALAIALSMFYSVAKETDLL